MLYLVPLGDLTPCVLVSLSSCERAVTMPTAGGTGD